MESDGHPERRSAGCPWTTYSAGNLSVNAKKKIAQFNGPYMRQRIGLTRRSSPAMGRAIAYADRQTSWARLSGRPRTASFHRELPVLIAPTRADRMLPNRRIDVVSICRIAWGPA